MLYQKSIQFLIKWRKILNI